MRHILWSLNVPSKKPSTPFFNDEAVTEDVTFVSIKVLRVHSHACFRERDCNFCYYFHPAFARKCRHEKSCVYWWQCFPKKHTTSRKRIRKVPFRRHVVGKHIK